MKERAHYTFEKEWWCNECDRFIYFPESVKPESCPRCGGSNIVLRDWKGYKRAKPSSSSIDPFDSRSSIGINFKAGFEKALTYTGLPAEDVFEIITLVEAQETESKHELPEKLFKDKSYRNGFTEGLISLIDDSNPR